MPIQLLEYTRLTPLILAFTVICENTREDRSDYYFRQRVLRIDCWYHQTVRASIVPVDSYTSPHKNFLLEWFIPDGSYVDDFLKAEEKYHSAFWYNHCTDIIKCRLQNEFVLYSQ